MKRVSATMVAAVLVYLVAATVPVSTYAQDTRPCKTCKTEGLGFAECEDAGEDEFGYRRCFPLGSWGCDLDQECQGSITEAHRVTPAGRVGFEARVIVASRLNTGIEHRPHRPDQCKGLIFRLQYSPETLTTRVEEQRQLTL